MRPLLLLFLGLIGCSTQSTSEDAREIVASGATVSVSRDAAVSNAVGSREHKQFVRAIIESANLESLSKVYAYGDGEYASSYQEYEAAARREFPTIFFNACPDWESLSYKATRDKQ